MGLWQSKEEMDSELSNMIKSLDNWRHMLGEISPELGVTDPESGPLVLEK